MKQGTCDVMDHIAVTGARMRRLRLLRGMKQRHLADLLGVDQATVSRWERGQQAMSDSMRRAAERLLAPDDGGQLDILRRLVESSTSRSHLICDDTHRLIATSPARWAEWGQATRLCGRSLFTYASPSIRKMETTLDGLGWRDGRLSTLEFEIDGNDSRVVPIAPGVVRWERIALANGAALRLVTTIA